MSGRVGARPVREHRTWRVQLLMFGVNERLNHKGEPMEAQIFAPHAYSVSAVDLIPDDVDEDTDPSEASVRQARYSQLGKLIGLEDIVEMVCCRLKDSVALQQTVADVLDNPPDVDNPRLHISDMMRLSRDVLIEIMGAIDEQLSVLDMIEEVGR